MEVLDLKGAAPVPGMREEGAGGGFGEVAGAGGRDPLSGVEVPKVPAARHAA